jgi:hypothetical protein
MSAASRAPPPDLPREANPSDGVFSGLTKKVRGTELSGRDVPWSSTLWQSHSLVPRSGIDFLTQPSGDPRLGSEHTVAATVLTPKTFEHGGPLGILPAALFLTGVGSTVLKPRSAVVRQTHYRTICLTVSATRCVAVVLRCEHVADMPQRASVSQPQIADFVRRLARARTCWCWAVRFDGLAFLQIEGK